MDQKAVNGEGAAWGKKRDGITDKTLDNEGCFGIGKKEKDKSAVEAVFGFEKDSVGGKCFFGFRHSTDRGLLYLETTIAVVFVVGATTVVFVVRAFV